MRRLVMAVVVCVVAISITGTADAATKRKLTLAASATTVAPGTTVVLAGKAPRSPRSTSVAIQERVGTGWHTVSTARTTNRAGSYRASLRLTNSGAVLLRASVKALRARRLGSATSPTVTVTVVAPPAPTPVIDPLPPAGTLGQLSAVTCPSTVTCIAVGSSNASTAAVATYANGTWTTQSLPMPAAEPHGSLDAIACPTPTFCAAVGGTTTGHPLVATFSGGVWTVRAPAAPGGLNQTSLQEVACSAAGSCVSLGLDQGPGSNGPQTTVTAVLAGGTWAVGTATLPFAPLGCAPGGDCYITDGLTIATLHAGAWSTQTAPTTTGWPRSPFMSAISCPEAGSCWAVGGDGAFDGKVGLVLHLDNGTWSAGTVPLPAGAPTGSSDVFLNGLSCSSPTSCAAAGQYEYPLQPGNPSTQWQEVPLVAALSQGTWVSASPTAGPGTSADSYEAVACPADGVCTATGTTVDATGAHFQVATLAAGTWSRQTVAVSTSGAWNPGVQGLACASPSVCVAVGTIYPALPGSGSLQPLVGTDVSGTWIFRDPTQP